MAEEDEERQGVSCAYNFRLKEVQWSATIILPCRIASSLLLPKATRCLIKDVTNEVNEGDD
jgi:hypothetical protein